MKTDRKKAAKAFAEYWKGLVLEGFKTHFPLQKTPESGTIFVW